MVEFISFLGLPGSGKENFSRRAAEETGAVLCKSPDEAKRTLKDGKDVVLDDTNVSSKTRKGFLDSLGKLECVKKCVIVATPIDVCFFNAGKEEVEPLLKKFNTPYYYEGWDEIEILFPEGIKPCKKIEKWVESVMDFEQNNSHHSETLGQHCVNVAKALQQDEILYYTGLIHDCGKPATKAFCDAKGNKTEEAHYYHHDNVGAYESLFYELPDSIDRLEVSVLIGLHMLPGSWQGEQVKQKYQMLWGEKLYERVMHLHDADMRGK